MLDANEFYEIEMKALLSKAKYDELFTYLKRNFNQTNEDTIYTTRFLPNDLRLRFSNKLFELVYKDGDATTISRKEIVIKLKSKEQIVFLTKILQLENYKSDAPWRKHKLEFDYEYKNFIYCLCLQNIENFGYIFEVEYLSKTNDVAIHEPNIREIMTQLNCEVIEPINFKEKISEYRRLYNK
jgi:hypothetical protein